MPGRLTKADTILEKTLKNLDLEKNFTVYPIHARWPSIVGTHAAEKSSPEEIRNETLIVSVANAVWMNELQLRSHEILLALKKMAAGTPVSQIRFRLRKASG